MVRSPGRCNVAQTLSTNGLVSVYRGLRCRPADGEESLPVGGGTRRWRGKEAQGSSSPLPSGLQERYSNGAGAGVDAERRTESRDVGFRALRQQVAEVAGDLSRDFGGGAVHHRSGTESGAKPRAVCFIMARALGKVYRL